MMREEWSAIKAQIDSFTASAEMIIAAHVGDAATSPASSALEKRADEIQLRLKGFLESYHADLPESCRFALSEHLKKGVSKLASPYNPGPRAITVAMPFMSLASEITYLLTDAQQTIHRQSERAFSHLRRSIEASENIRNEWLSVFSKGETACEKLGAAHLLLHGIFAFKVNAAGARTDLVFTEPVNVNEVAAIAQGLVLKDWKLVKEPGEVETIARQARNQAKLYTTSALAGVELRTYRYIVLVSNVPVNIPSDLLDADVTYRHINICVQPQSPSVAARKQN